MLRIGGGIPHIQLALTSQTAGAWWAYASAAVVLLGVVGETIAELTPWVKPECRARKLAKVSALVLIVGLTAELISIRTTQLETARLNQEAGEARKTAGEASERTAQAESHLAEANERIAALNAESNKARAGIAISQAESAKANARAAEANQKAEEERLTRLKLEETLAPRRITITEKTNDELSVFAGTKVFVECVLDSEAQRLAGQIIGMLNQAKWNLVGTRLADASIAGVGVFTIRGKNAAFFENPWDDAAKILSYQLEDNKIDAQGMTSIPATSGLFPPNFAVDTVLIHIDLKPQPYFTGKLNEKLIDESTRKSIEQSMAQSEQAQQDIRKLEADNRRRIMQKYQHP